MGLSRRETRAVSRRDMHAQIVADAEVKAARQAAIGMNPGVIVYNTKDATWTAVALADTPERSRHAEVFFYNDLIAFDPSLSLEAMLTVIKRTPNRIPIAPEDRLFLEIWVHGRSTDLAQQIAEVWHRLPENCRHDLSRHWQTDPMHYPDGPSIKYVDWVLDKNRKVSGWIDRCGNDIVFRGYIVDRMPETIVDSLIAHLFASVVLMAQAPSTARYTIAKADERALTEHWGFDPFDHMEWEQHHKKQIMLWARQSGKSGNKFQVSQG